MGGDEEERVVIRDNRKIDRQVATDGVADAAAVVADLDPVTDVDENAVLLEERTRDLQRLQAEYANYRKRAERDRLLAGDVAVGRVLADLLPVVDDLDRAKAHGDVTGPLKAVADKLDGVLDKLGLVAFGEVGDPFDPSIHEAVLHDESDAVTVPTCTTLMRPGYRHRDRLLRPAMVGVSDPATSAATPLDDHDQDQGQGAATESEWPAINDPNETSSHPTENEVRDGTPPEQTDS